MRTMAPLGVIRRRPWWGAVRFEYMTAFDIGLTLCHLRFRAGFRPVEGAKNGGVEGANPGGVGG